MDDQVEHEICGNCKKEIPQHNYVMHTAHCARNITLCHVCKEPIPKSQFADHKQSCQPVTAVKTSKPAVKDPIPLTSIERSQYFQERKSVEDKKVAARKERQLAKLEKFVDIGHVAKGNKAKEPQQEYKSTISGASAIKPKTVLGNSNGNKGLFPCKYCDLELPKGEVESHEDYCGSRTDRCLECGELVMFKYKQIHMDTNHGFLKLSDEPGPRPSWDSTTQRSPTTNHRPRPPPLTSYASLYDTTLYSFPSTVTTTSPAKDKGESYKEISRRLDCKTEYIRNLLHDSASITVPLRHNGAVPRNHFNHNKGPAPQPPRSAARTRNPPTELTIPCEFCATPIPHDDLIQHESGCRPDLARYTPRSARGRHSTRALEEDDYDDGYFSAAAAISAPSGGVPSSPEVELPCEFCADLIPASQLLRHQATCN